MKIVLNGAWRELPGSAGLVDLPTALRLLGFGGAVVATALNGEFVPVSARAHTALRDGDRLEVLAPMQGG